MTAVGVDGCKAGWFYVVLARRGARHGVSPSLADLLPGLPDAASLFVDMPIGLLEAGPGERGCEVAARRLLGPRAASVFAVPCRQALSAPDYATASRINRRVLGRGLSRQSWNLLPRIREVDELMATGPRQRIRESHPEVCFRGLAGAPMRHAKNTRAGIAERLDVLSKALPDARDLAARAFFDHGGREVARDDVLDALALAICAHGPGTVRTLPAAPVRDPRGLAMEMVYRLPA